MWPGARPEVGEINVLARHWRRRVSAALNVGESEIVVISKVEVEVVALWSGSGAPILDKGVVVVMSGSMFWFRE